MTQILQGRGGARPLAIYLRPATIAASWLALVALATGCFFAPRGTEVQPTLNDVVGFGCSMAIAGAAAAIAAFGIGGRRRWAVEMALCVLFVGAIVALLLLYFLWFDPTFARRQMDLWSFVGLQQSAQHWAVQLAGYHGPLGAVVGIALGAVTGLLIKLGQQRPRLAMGMALALLFAFTSASGRQLAFSLVTLVGRVIRYLFVPWSISDDQISNTGMIFGAIAGCAVAGVAMYATRPRPGGVAAAPHPAHSGQAVS
jgi:hypothetical protein